MASDDFNRANANPLDGSWTKPTPATALRLVSNAVLNSSASVDAGAFSSVSTVLLSQVKVTVIGSKDGGPAICMDAAGNGYVFNNAVSNELALYTITTWSTFSKIATAAGDYVANDVLKIERSGGNVICSINGTSKITFADSTFTTGAPGMHAFDGTITFDDWTDGVAGGPLNGALSLQGFAPTVVSPVFVQPSAGGLVIVRTTPLVPAPLFKVDPQDNVSLVGGNAVVGGLQGPQTQSAVASRATVALVGQTPAVTISGASGTTITPSVGAMVLAGAAPAVAVAFARQPSVGGLALAGQVPAVTQAVLLNPPAGALSLAGLSPSVGTAGAIAPAAGALSLAGSTPSLTQALIVQPAPAGLALAGSAPLVGQALTVGPVAGALALAGAAPAVTRADTVQPTAAAIALAGSAPGLVRADTVQPAAGALAVAGQLAVTGGNRVAQPSAGALALAGSVPGVGGSVTVQPNTATMVLATSTPIIVATDNRSAQPSAGAVTLAGQAPAVTRTSGFVANPLTGALIAVQQTPALAQTQHVARQPGAGALALAGLAPVALLPNTFTANSPWRIGAATLPAAGDRLGGTPLRAPNRRIG